MMDFLKSIRGRFVIVTILVVIGLAIAIFITGGKFWAIDAPSKQSSEYSEYVYNITDHLLAESFINKFGGHKKITEELATKYQRIRFELNKDNYFYLQSEDSRKRVIDSSMLSQEDKNLVFQLESAPGGTFEWLIINYPTCNAQRGLGIIEKVYAQSNNCNDVKKLLADMKQRADLTKYINDEIERNNLVPIFKSDLATDLDRMKLVLNDITRTTVMECKKKYPTNSSVHHRHTSILVKDCHVPRTIDILYTSKSFLKEFSKDQHLRKSFTAKEVEKLRRSSELLKLLQSETSAWEEVREIEDIYKDLLLAIPFFEIPGATVKGITVASHLLKSSKAAAASKPIVQGSNMANKLATNRVVKDVKVSAGVVVKKTNPPLRRVQFSQAGRTISGEVDLNRFSGKLKLSSFLTEKNSASTALEAIAEETYQAANMFVDSVYVTSSMRKAGRRLSEFNKEVEELFHNTEIWGGDAMLKEFLCSPAAANIDGKKIIINASKTGVIFNSKLGRVANPDKDLTRVMIHELAHSFSKNTSSCSLSIYRYDPIEEGVTEYIARKILAENGHRAYEYVYNNEVLWVQELEKAIDRGIRSGEISGLPGVERIFDAYFADGFTELDRILSTKYYGNKFYTESLFEKAYKLLSAGESTEAMKLLERLYR